MRVFWFPLGLAMVLSCVTPAMAQGSWRATFQGWDGDRLITQEGRKLRILRRSGAPVELALPPWTRYVDFREGVAWAIAGDSDLDKSTNEERVAAHRRTFLFRSFDLKRWEKVYEFNWSREVDVNRFIPLEHDRFFLMGRFKFKAREEAALFAVAELDDQDRLRIRELVHLNLPGPELLFGIPPALIGKFKTPNWFPNPAFLRLGDVRHSPVLRYPGGFALISFNAGVLWTFDGDTGHLRKRIEIFPSLGPDTWGETEPFTAAVLDAKPRPNGHLLVATRTLAAVTDAKNYFPELEPPKSHLFGFDNEDLDDVFPDQAKHKLEQEIATKRLLKYGGIAWWDVDPDLGDVHPETPPLGVPTEFKSLRELENFNFRFKADGNLDVKF